MREQRQLSNFDIGRRRKEMKASIRREGESPLLCSVFLPERNKIEREEEDGDNGGDGWE